MRFKKQFLLLSIFILLTSSAHAQLNYTGGFLTTQEIERVREFKDLLGGVDKKSVEETIDELEKTRHPQISLAMREAMAKAYIDIVRDFNVEGQKKKEWLYSMICLNMAYLQFGGAQGKVGSTTELNRLIRQKLIAYLPRNINTQPGFLNSLE